ncbi:exopolyphosphatase [Georgenia sp. Z1344]|uniref:Ppx/GppA phosphatase family protein n=1 Tax=Georgenia sp. Z1344 TaxID=3416706 RepID=UPI003CF9FE97
MTRAAAIDCGTNSIRLLVADVPGAGGAALDDVVREMRVVRLGQGVDRTGRLAEDALERTFAAAREYAQLCEQHGAERIRFVATSATRDAENRQVFVDGIREILGVEPEVVTGEAEAALSFAGAASVLAEGTPGPVVVVDIGGGSTELVVGDPRSATPDAAVSLDVGCVRLTERHLVADPPSAEQEAAARADVRRLLEDADLPLGGVRTLIGVAGSVTTVTAHALGLPAYDPAAINGSVLTEAAVLAACDELLAASRAQREAMPFMHPGRIDVIGGGALVWSEVVRHVSERTGGAGTAGVVTSEHDILDGIALSLA